MNGMKAIIGEKSIAMNIHSLHTLVSDSISIGV